MFLADMNGMETAKWPSSAAFDDISAALQNDKDKKDAIKTGGAVFAFQIKNTAGEEKSWFVDLKETGAIGEGAAPAGKKADGKNIHNSYIHTHVR